MENGKTKDILFFLVCVWLCRQTAKTLQRKWLTIIIIMIIFQVIMKLAPERATECCFPWDSRRHALVGSLIIR